MDGLIKYYMGVDPGMNGGAALISVDPDHVVDVVSAIPFDRIAREYAAQDVWSWFAMHQVRQVVIEKVVALSGQAGQSVLVHSRGWWDGVVSLCGAVPLFPAPAMWKPRAGIPPLGSGASKLDLKTIAVRRAEEVFPGVSFRGPRGGITSKDWLAEAALMAWTGWRHELGIRPYTGKIYEI